MDDLLTEDDFNDFAAAVGEGADGSDDDARVSNKGSYRVPYHFTPNSNIFYYNNSILLSSISIISIFIYLYDYREPYKYTIDLTKLWAFFFFQMGWDGMGWF